MRTRVRIGDKGVAEEKLHEIVKRAEDYSSWVGDTVRRAIPNKSDVEIV